MASASGSFRAIFGEVSHSIQTASVIWAHSLRPRGALPRRMAMSHVGQSRHYAEERDEPPRRRSIPWRYSPPSKASEYHLIDLVAGCSEGGFETLAGARQGAREKGLSAWDIFHGNVRVEYHDPR
jgi:hypothetical protein